MESYRIFFPRGEDTFSFSFRFHNFCVPIKIYVLFPFSPSVSKDLCLYHKVHFFSCVNDLFLLLEEVSEIYRKTGGQGGSSEGTICQIMLNLKTIPRRVNLGVL